MEVKIWSNEENENETGVNVIMKTERQNNEEERKYEEKKANDKLMKEENCSVMKNINELILICMCNICLKKPTNMKRKK